MENHEKNNSIIDIFIKKILSEKIQPFYFFIIISIWFLSFCTYTSPLFYFDYSPDNNTFFTVGKAMMHGIIPYKDVFEQKGPYVYLMHGLASLISFKSLMGIFPFEVISLSLSMWFVYKIACLHVKKYKSIIISLLTPVLYLFHPYFNYGDTTESILFPCVIYLIYIIIKNENNHFELSNREWTIQGFIVGLVFLSKYNQLGSWIVFYPVIFIFYLYNKKYLHAFNLFIWSLVGFLSATIPWLIYFLITNSLNSFLKIYFYDNINLYVSNNNSIFSKIIEALATYSQFLRNDPLIFVAGFVGIIYILFSNTLFKTTFGKVLFVLLDVFSAVFITYGYADGTVYLYYELAFMPYILIPLIAILIKVFDLNKKKLNITLKNSYKYIILSSLLSFFVVLGVNNNVLSSRLFPNNASVTKETTTKPEQPAQIQFAKKIDNETSSHTTMLNYGSIDMGFYTAAGILPSIRYFQNYNFSKNQDPAIMNTQDNAIKNKKVDWVVLNTPMGMPIQDWNGVSLQNGKITNGNVNPGTKAIAPYLYANYDIVAYHDQSFESQNLTYWLLKAKRHSVSFKKIRRFLAGKPLNKKKHHVKRNKNNQLQSNQVQQNVQNQQQGPNNNQIQQNPNINQNQQQDPNNQIQQNQQNAIQ